MEDNKNYRLKSDAVERLSDDSPTPEYSQEELNRYRPKRRFRLPPLAVTLVVKAWFPGAVCFFFYWGLSNYITGLIDMLFVLGVALGVVTDLLTNNVIRFFEEEPGQMKAWLMFPKKSFASFFWNILYSFALLAGVYMLYTLINTALGAITGQPGTLFLGVEPVLFGVFTLGMDLICLGMKRLLLGIVSNARSAAGGSDHNG